jgi:hypothetical protein
MSRTTTRITNFSAGMAADLRSSSGFGLLQHFKVYPHKLVPEFSTEADETKASAMVRFVYAPWLSTTAFALFGYGIVSTSRPAISIKGNTTGDIIADTWGTPAGGADAAAGAREATVFFYYKGYFYGFAGGTRLWRWGKIDDVSGSAWTDTYQSISYTNVAQPVHHSNDDCAYYFVDNKVYRLNNTTWDGLVLTLPDNLIITSGEPYGNYLAIACKSKSGLGNSVVFLWDRDSSLTTISQRIDWGAGNLFHLANLNGELIGVTDYYMNSSLGHSVGKLIVKRAASEQATTLREYESDSGTDNQITGNKVIADDKLHFPMRLHRNGVALEGIFAVDHLGNLSLPVVEEEVTSGRIQGIAKTGQYWWIAHSGDGSLNRTNDQTTYAHTSILETNIIGTPDVQSQFVGASVSFEPLPSGGSVKLYCRKVGTTSWGSAIKTVTTTGATVLSATKDASSQAPTFYELQYRIESTGGAVITGLEWTHETNDQKPYGRS